MYREYRDEGETFTGILAMDSAQTKFWKLNDPNYMGFEPGDTVEDLAGTGHLMDVNEVVCDLMQYNLDPTERTNGDTKDIGNILRDFKDKPADFDVRDPQGRFNQIFPHGRYSTGPGRWLIPEIRAGDKVKIMATKHLMGMGFPPATERLWVEVEAVSNPGIITGLMNNDIDSPFLRFVDMDPNNIDPNYRLKAWDRVSFPVTCVFGVDHGPNWNDECANCGKGKAALEEENQVLSKCARCLKFSYCSKECQRAHWKIHKKDWCQPVNQSGDN